MDVEAFQSHLRRTHEAGLVNAVNMDTGYVNYLSEQERLSVLQWTREALGPGTRFVAGAYIEGAEGEIVSLYRREMDLMSPRRYPDTFPVRKTSQPQREGEDRDLP